jgi:hypothetical protein
MLDVRASHLADETDLARKVPRGLLDWSWRPPMLPIETIAKRTALESLPMLRMSPRNVTRSRRVKSNRAVTLRAPDGYVGTLPSLFNGHRNPLQDPLTRRIGFPRPYFAIVHFAHVFCPPPNYRLKSYPDC